MLSIILQQVYRVLCNIISPPICSYCKEFIPHRTILCARCFAKIEPVISCKITLTNNKELTVYALSKYQDPLKSLILRKNNQTPLSSIQLGQLMAQHLLVDNILIDYLIPVPLHWTRYARRGFNQAEIIAHQLAKQYNGKVVSCMWRSRRTAYQSYFTGEKRTNNVKHVFNVIERKASLLTGKHIVIVDDLMTSGATLKEMAKTLQAFKPASISAFVACRTSSL